jgi:hypothetical protein
MPSLLPLVLTPRRDLFYPPVLHSLSVYSESKGVSSDMYILCINQINSHYLLFLCHHAPLLFNSLRSITLYYIHI